MSAVIFSGDNVKTLKSGLLLSQAGTNYASIISKSGVDPRVTATDAMRGSLFIDTTYGRVFKKTDDGSSTNWVLLSTHGSMKLDLLELGNAPIITVENYMPVYLFEAGLSQELYTDFLVPRYYDTGGTITIRAQVYCPSTSGTILLRAQSTLIKNDSYGVSSTVTQRTTTNSAITMSGSNDDEPLTVALDISETDGQINGSDIAPNDTIRVKIYRDTDTATGDLKLLKNQLEVIFT